MISAPKLTLKGIGYSMALRGIETGGRVQKFIDSEVLRLSAPYVPHQSGVLEGSGTRHTKLGQGKVIYQTPYAKRLYYNPQYNFTGAPMRGGYWFERMKADHKEAILKGALAEAGGK